MKKKKFSRMVKKSMTIFEHMIEPNHETDFIQTENFEPEPLTDEDLCRLEEEVFQNMSDETLARIYEEL